MASSTEHQPYPTLQEVQECLHQFRPVLSLCHQSELWIVRANPRVQPALGALAHPELPVRSNATCLHKPSSKPEPLSERERCEGHPRAGTMRLTGRTPLAATTPTPRAPERGGDRRGAVRRLPVPMDSLRFNPDKRTWMER